MKEEKQKPITSIITYGEVKGFSSGLYGGKTRDVWIPVEDKHLDYHFTEKLREQSRIATLDHLGHCFSFFRQLDYIEKKWIKTVQETKDLDAKIQYAGSSDSSDSSRKMDEFPESLQWKDLIKFRKSFDKTIRYSSLESTDGEEGTSDLLKRMDEMYVYIGLEPVVETYSFIEKVGGPERWRYSEDDLKIYTVACSCHSELKSKLAKEFEIPIIPVGHGGSKELQKIVEKKLQQIK